MPEHDRRRYAETAMGPPLLWSVESHLARCVTCRDRLTVVVDPALLATGWQRLDAELDAPEPGAAERLIRWLGVSDHTARLLVATPALRLSWLLSIALTLALTAAVARAAGPLMFLATAPLLPLIGVAVSFGPGVDPTYELTVVSPIHTFRLLLLRCSAVLATTTALSAAASLALPEHDLTAVSWFLPSLALTLVSLAVTPRLGPALAAGAVGLCWLLAVVATVGMAEHSSFAATVVAQFAAVVVAALAGGALFLSRSAFDTTRRLHAPFRSWIRRIP